MSAHQMLLSTPQFVVSIGDIANAYASTSSSDQNIKGWTFKPDGNTVLAVAATATPTLPDWGSPLSTDIGSGYWVRVSYNVVDNTPSITQTGTFDTWLQMNVDRTFGFSKPSTGNPGTASTAYTINISTDSSGTKSKELCEPFI